MGFACRMEHEFHPQQQQNLHQHPRFDLARYTKYHENAMRQKYWQYLE
jgi:hypothetical protein